MDVRAYDSDTDENDLWRLKRAFERGLGANTGGEEKETAYEDKLTDDYRERYLDWVERCTEDEPDCVTVAALDGGLVGYAFVLPERLAMIWDAAVLNEIYVAPEYRGSGVADDLIAAAIGTARDQDLPLDRIVLDVDPKNDRAQAFYDNYGFEPWGEMVARPL
ncbi:GNAT family N-acetyltransferase [Halostella sp. PRR32]|uniref:GNAT family N-acetyltransferase n=1 Tax=Halostella sp. PRR32 TaxID=3098147 RepID=UPI002B1DC392|nr:GNAT family N-acetyltransferase [Halostella sp. PRR32]